MEREPIAASCIYAGRKRRIALALVTALLLSSVLALPAAVQAEGRLPDGAPDLLNPRIRASWQSYLLGKLESDPDFPVVVYLNVSDGAPAAVRALAEGQNGVMVAINPPRIEYVPLRQAVAKMKTVPLDSDGIVTARTLDISLGD